MFLLKEIETNKEKINDFDRLKNSLFKYNEIITNIENQSCSHRSDFKKCCGMSYEYFNDIFCRDVLENILSNNSNKTQEIIIKELEPLDKRLKNLCRKGFVYDVNSTEKELLKASKYWNENEEKWWNKYLPKGVNC